MESLIQLGYIGLFIGSFLASTIIPFSADVLLIGILAMGGNIWICLAVATLGNWMGGMTSYWIGWIGKWQWIEKWLKVKEDQLIRQKQHIDRFGSLLAFMTWLPLVGDLFAIALGFYRISPKLSALYMLLGRFTRFFIWVVLYIKYADQFTALFQ